jgi:plexin A
MTHGAAYCPRLKRPSDEDDLVPSGVARELVLEAENLPHPQAGHAGFQCLVDIEGAKMAIGARIEAGRYVVCDKTTVFHQLLSHSLFLKIDFGSHAVGFRWQNAASSATI